MDLYTEEWRLIANGFPISHPPDYEMLGIGLTDRLQFACVPIAVLNTGAAPLLRFASLCLPILFRTAAFALVPVLYSHEVAS